MNNHYGSAAHSEAELLWMETESLKPVKEVAVSSIPSAIFLVVVVLGIMYPYVNSELWLAWVAVHCVCLLMRIAYISYIKSGKAEKSSRYHFNNMVIIGMIAMTWGSTVYPLIAGDRSKMEILILNLIFVYGVSGSITLSQNLKTWNIFFICYGTGLLGAVVGTILFTKQSNQVIDNVVMSVFMFLFLLMLNKFATEVNKSHMKSLSLQYRNKQLIESLMVEKQTAINAVDVKNRIMASATHDMRQPILALDLYTDMLISAPENLYKLVPKISEATKSVITMFDAMFDLARMSMNQIQPEKTKFSLRSILLALEQQYQAVAKDKGLDFRVQYKNTDVEIYDDPILLRRIISNLVSNAIKYTNEGGVLLVCRNCEKYGFRVEVWDTGVGISPSMQKAVFSEFYKNPENTGTSEGFGLGLSIVSQLCDLLEHKLTMKSRRGHGTVVSIRLANSLLHEA
jgi:signal transduction histidine kinase